MDVTRLNILVMLRYDTSNLSQATRLVQTLNSQPMGSALDSKGLSPRSPALIQGLP